MRSLSAHSLCSRKNALVLIILSSLFNLYLFLSAYHGRSEQISSDIVFAVNLSGLFPTSATTTTTTKPTNPINRSLVWNEDDPFPVRLVNSTGSQDLDYPMKIDVPEIVRLTLDDQTVPIDPINYPNFTMLVSNIDICDHFEQHLGQPPLLLILIKSDPKNFLQRDAIRSTWGNSHCWGGRHVVRLFLLGTIAMNENVQHRLTTEIEFYGDIIQQQFIDHYHNNTYKLMFGIEWAVRFCPKAPLIMFADDDFFIHPRNVIGFVEGLSSGLKRLLIGGYLWENASPVRKGKASKWRVTWVEYPNSRYPPYVAGGHFFLSMKIAHEVNVAARYTRYFRLDDVFLGIVLKKMVRRVIHLPEIYAFSSVNRSSSQIKTMLSTHLFQKSTDQFVLWNLTNSRTFCLM